MMPFDQAMFHIVLDGTPFLMGPGVSSHGKSLSPDGPVLHFAPFEVDLFHKQVTQQIGSKTTVIPFCNTVVIAMRNMCFKLRGMLPLLNPCSENV
jgi:hypothetical protein